MRGKRAGTTPTTYIILILLSSISPLSSEYYSRGADEMKSYRMRVARRHRDDREQSQLQLQCELAIQAPGGVSKVLQLLEGASNDDIHLLNEARYTPLVGCIFRLGKNTTLKGNSSQSQLQLDELIETCYRRKLSLNTGAMFGACFHRPLIVAAYYGYYSAVRLLLQKGALPDLCDGEGKNVLYAAFQNPTGRNTLRECDKKVAEILWEMGAVTSDLGEWRKMNVGHSLGSMCYSNSVSVGSSFHRSVMYQSLNNKCLQTMKFMVEKGSVITDEDFLRLAKCKLFKRFLSMVACLESSTSPHAPRKVTAQVLQRIKSWKKEIDWSFPPTWKVAVILCQNCGLPDDIFHNNIVPFLSRDWFYTKEQRLRPVIQQWNR
jgi:hypothetical protein